MFRIGQWMRIHPRAHSTVEIYLVSRFIDTFTIFSFRIVFMTLHLHLSPSDPPANPKML